MESCDSTHFPYNFPPRIAASELKSYMESCDSTYFPYNFPLERS